MSLSSLKFPHKLFRIVTECKSGCIRWSSDGNSVLISFPMFQKQYLADNTFFKTHQMSSFVRSLNIYGFEKQRNERRIHIPGQNEYRHKHFMRDFPNFLELVTRKTGRIKSATAKPKPVLKTKENKSHGRKSSRKRSKLADQNKDASNKENTAPLAPERTLQEISKTWLGWMKDVGVRKDDLDVLVREEQRWIDFDEVEYDHVSWDDTGSIAIPPKIFIVPRSSASVPELGEIATDK